MLTSRHLAKRILRPAFLCSIALLLALVVWTGTAPLSARDRHLLWSVATDQGRVTLMGSVHTLRRDVYPLPAPYEQAYRDATHLVFETDMARMNDPATQAQLLALGLYPEGETLAESLSPDIYSALAGALEERGLPPAQFSRFKPWFCALTLAMLELQRLGYSPQYGLDVHFFNRARQDGKEVFHLEAVEDHFQLLTSFEQTGQEEDFLLQSLQELKVLESMASRMTEAWRSGDADGLDEIMGMGFEGFPDLQERLITERNRNWLPAIEGLIRDGKNALVIVGAGHLVGSQGLIRLLEDRGYVLEQH